MADHMVHLAVYALGREGYADQLSSWVLNVMQSTTRTCALIPTLALLITGPSVAQVKRHVPIEDVPYLVEAAFGHCYHNIDDVSRIEAAAKVFKWVPLSQDALALFAPVEKSGYKAWGFREKTATLLIGINRGFFRNRPANVCSIIMRVTVEQFLIEAKKLIDIKLLHSDPDALQITDMYSIESRGQKSVYISVLHAKDGQPPINVSFIGLQ